MSEIEMEKLANAVEEGILCDERYCPYVAGRTSRLGACEGDFCEQAWFNYCDEKGEEQ